MEGYAIYKTGRYHRVIVYISVGSFRYQEGPWIKQLAFKSSLPNPCIRRVWCVCLILIVFLFCCWCGEKVEKNKRSQSKFVRIKWKPFDQRGNWEHCVNGFSDLPMFAEPNLGLVLNCVKRGLKVLIYKADMSNTTFFTPNTNTQYFHRGLNNTQYQYQFFWWVLNNTQYQ